MYRQVGATNDKMMAELFCPLRVTPRFRQLTNGNGVNFDLTTGWNCYEWTDRGSFRRWQCARKPNVLLTCCECTQYSSLQATNRDRVDPDVRAARLQMANIQLKFSMDSCKEQYDNNRGFVHEHPGRATSWQEASVEAIARLPGVEKVVFDQCRFDLRSPAGHLLKKETILLTNMPSIVARFQGMRCTGNHEHGRIQGHECGVSVSRHAARYPPAMVEALAQASAEFCESQIREW